MTRKNAHKKLPLADEYNNFAKIIPIIKERQLRRQVNKKYIDVRVAHASHLETISNIPPEDIIFFAHCFDMNFDRPSENTGHFLTVAYLDDNEIKAKEYNLVKWRPIKEFIEKNGSKFAQAEYSGTLFNYFNKKMLPDLKIEDGALIYKDKYRFTEENMGQALRANLNHLEMCWMASTE